MLRFLAVTSLLSLVLPLMGISPVSAASITVTSPTTNECMAVGAPYTLKWTSSMPTIDHVAIAYRADGQQAQPSSTHPADYFTVSAPSTGSYKWTAPATATSTGKLTFEALAIDNTVLSTTTSDLFTVAASTVTAPELTLKSQDVTSATLSWKAPKACSTHTGYKLYRNDTLVTTLDATDTTVTQANLTNGTTYSYRLDAFDATTTVSSNVVMVKIGTTPSASPSLAPSPTSTTIFDKVKVVETAQTTATLTFEIDLNIPAAAHYGATTTYGKNVAATLEAKGAIWIGTVKLKDLEPGTTYQWQIIATDADGKIYKSLNHKLATDPVDVVTPTVTSMSIGDEALSADLTFPAKIIEKEQISLRGTATPNSKVVITVHSKVRTYEAVTDDDGNWQIVIDTKGLEQGNHEVKVASKDAKGNVGKAKPILKFQLVPRAAAAPLTFSVADTQRASNTGRVYGITFLTITCAGCAWFILQAHRGKHQKRHQVTA